MKARCRGALTERGSVRPTDSQREKQTDGRIELWYRMKSNYISIPFTHEISDTLWQQTTHVKTHMICNVKYLFYVAHPIYKHDIDT